MRFEPIRVPPKIHVRGLMHPLSDVRASKAQVSQIIGIAQKHPPVCSFSLSGPASSGPASPTSQVVSKFAECPRLLASNIAIILKWNGLHRQMRIEISRSLDRRLSHLGNTRSDRSLTVTPLTGPHAAAAFQFHGACRLNERVVLQCFFDFSVADGLAPADHSLLLPRQFGQRSAARREHRLHHAREARGAGEASSGLCKRNRGSSGAECRKPR